MRLSILASVLSGLLAGIAGALIVVIADDHDPAQPLPIPLLEVAEPEVPEPELGITVKEGSFLLEITLDPPDFTVLRRILPRRPVDVVYVDQEGEQQVVEVIPELRTRDG